MGADVIARGSTPELLARLVGVRPLYLVESSGVEGLAVARWRFEGFQSLEDRNPETILSYRAAGAGYATKYSGGRAIRKRPRIGSVTFFPGDGAATWALDGPAEVVHLYLRPEHFERFAEGRSGADPVARIVDFFAIDDPWLDGYFRMLTSEFEGHDGVEQATDSLLVDETVHLVSRHLVRWHSDAEACERRVLDLRTKVSPLRPALVRRVEQYVDDNLARDVTLAELACLCCMSVDHFLRSFRAARGTTPYRYVLDQRLRRASTLLRPPMAPVASVAVECGFRSHSHFSTKFHASFGVSPSQFRRTA
jgi:AraC family transcriptional regulator